MHRQAVAYSHGDRRPTCNVEQAREHLGGCSRSHVYNLVNKGESNGGLSGYYIGTNRGLRIYLDSIDKFKRRNSVEERLGDCNA